MFSERKVDFYLVLERARYWGDARIVAVKRRVGSRPKLRAGQVAVKLRLRLPDAVFDPQLDGGEVKVPAADVLRAVAGAVEP